MTEVYRETKEKLSGRQLFNSLWPVRPNSYYLFTFHSSSFSIGIYHNYELRSGKQVNEPVVPDPDTLFAAMDRLANKFDDNTLSFLGNVDYCINGCIMKRDMQKQHIINYNWPSTWLADYHVFRKLYYNFCQNFNSKNLLIK